MSTTVSERRRSDRKPTSGRVKISFADPIPTTVDAELTETSASGFRIVHESRELIAGLAVQLLHDQASKRARVVWTHLLDGRRVSGCVLL